MVSSLSEPFKIPKFREETEESLKEEVLTDGDRRYMVQTLATVLMTLVQRPSLADCEVVAQTLIEKFRFLNDDEGDSEVISAFLWLM